MSAQSSSVAPASARKLTTTLHPDEFPPEYAMICDGKCLEPVYMDGAKLMFSRDERYRTGDFVMLHKRPEFVVPGDHQMIVKRLVIAPTREYWQPGWTNRSGLAPTVVVEMLNPRRILYIDPAKLLGIHKCVGLVPEDRLSTRILSDDDVRREYPVKAVRS